ncbi:CYTH domain-containing protein [Halomonas campisalis]|uniref:CYTH domain-containing protein n=1 Tax=Billgrantia campisalis TaxID=74661 RepID=A0ABS9P9I8_9GAMM|nr:CYTH domain-containing protein [Halomonas campisalis]MCG6658428.1 CYTH domain-containing protein [Halomonas campisalis]MDR5863099.1 CYTH domain-containing protein [Halomonas campisalis]
MSHEIELKLALGPEGPEQLPLHPRLAARPAEQRRLTNTYFDTPDGELERARMALRLRRDDQRWVQTLKTEGDSHGGLSRRGEWEWPLAEGVLDRAGLAELPPMAALDPALITRLAPHFTTDFTRRIWRLEVAGADIEAALDIGEITAGGHGVAIRELELELKTGEPEALWQLAGELAERVALRPADTSKAARGNALLTGEWTLPAGGSDAAWLHRATVALDAQADTGDPDWQAAAREALGRLAERQTDAAALANALAQDAWLTPAFGQAALRLAQRLAATA